ncbi:MAG TPA: hypothetical protein VES02_01015 [Dermatophilaceae bacterium]|nr:hypothetical protein [Dermatophilaceae bacterium]
MQLVCRSGVSAYYRSDVTSLERLHGITVTGLSLENFADQARSQF